MSRLLMKMFFDIVFSNQILIINKPQIINQNCCLVSIITATLDLIVIKYLLLSEKLYLLCFVVQS